MRAIINDLMNPLAIRADTDITPAEMYLELLKRVLTRSIIAGPPERHTLYPSRPMFKAVHAFLKMIFGLKGLELVRVHPYNPENYLESGHEAKNRFEDAETMIGMRQLDNLQDCIADVLKNHVPGDLIEAGVWRGGAAIFMRGALKAFGDTTARVWVADSFSGLPPVDPRKEYSFEWKAGEMAISLEAVKENFDRYGLLDEGVSFLKGFFSDTLPGPIQRLSILRVDADLFQSTTDVLTALYPKLSPGGYAIFDDYQNLPDCRRAIDQYRETHGISDEIRRIDRRAVFWQKSR